MVANERDPLAFVDEQRVGGAVAGAGDEAQIAVSCADLLPVREQLQDPPPHRVAENVKGVHGDQLYQ